MFKILCTLFIFFNFVHACALCNNNKVSFVQASIKAYVAEEELQKIEVTWQFSASTSAEIVKLYHIEKQMQPSDQLKIYDSLEQYQKPSFMTSIQINGKSTHVEAKNFDIFLENKLVTIRFEIPLNYALQDKNTVEIVFIDSARTMVFLENIDHTSIINTTNFKTRKDNGIKVIPEIMATTNYIKLDISKF